MSTEKVALEFKKTSILERNYRSDKSMSEKHPDGAFYSISYEDKCEATKKILAQRYKSLTELENSVESIANGTYNNDVLSNFDKSLSEFFNLYNDEEAVLSIVDPNSKSQSLNSERNPRKIDIAAFYSQLKKIENPTPMMSYLLGVMYNLGICNNKDIFYEQSLEPTREERNFPENRSIPYFLQAAFGGCEKAKDAIIGIMHLARDFGYSTDEKFLETVGTAFFLFGNEASEKGDLTNKRKYYEMASCLGNYKAANNLGNIYYDGEGVPQNYENALVQYQIAIDNGGISAYKMIADILVKSPKINNYELNSTQKVCQWLAKALENVKNSQHENRNGIFQDVMQCMNLYIPQQSKDDLAKVYSETLYNESFAPIHKAILNRVDGPQIMTAAAQNKLGINRAEVPQQRNNTQIHGSATANVVNGRGGAYTQGAQLTNQAIQVTGNNNVVCIGQTINSHRNNTNSNQAPRKF
jgi:hypothetical protein